MKRTRQIDPRRMMRRGPGRPGRAESDVHRDALLDTATSVFLESGYEAASLNEIARRAGASKNTLYRLFPTKSDLFLAMILRRIRTRFVDPEELLQTGAGKPADVLRTLAVRLLTGALADDHPQLRRVVIQAAQQFPDLSQAYFNQTTAPLLKRIAAYLESLAASGSLAIADANEAADVFLSLVVGVTPTLVDLNLLSPDRRWIERRARDRVGAFMRLYASNSRAWRQVPSGNPVRIS